MANTFFQVFSTTDSWCSGTCSLHHPSSGLCIKYRPHTPSPKSLSSIFKVFQHLTAAVNYIYNAENINIRWCVLWFSDILSFWVRFFILSISIRIKLFGQHFILKVMLLQFQAVSSMLSKIKELFKPWTHNIHIQAFSRISSTWKNPDKRPHQCNRHQYSDRLFKNTQGIFFNN